MLGNTKTCKIEGCKNHVWGNGLCANHKPRKPLNSGGKKLVTPERKKRTMDTREVFMSIWNKRPKRSEVSGAPLGIEPLTIFFHHILPKEKYPQACLDEENIILLTGAEHSFVESDMYRFDEVNKRRNYLKTKYHL